MYGEFIFKDKRAAQVLEYFDIWDAQEHILLDNRNAGKGRQDSQVLFACSDVVFDGYNGTEFTDYENIAKCLKTKFFFARPYSSWEKRLVENTNKLIRQYIPKKTKSNTLNNQQIKQIQYKINNRARKIQIFIHQKKFVS
jgi:IS30 family transposase